MSNIEKKTDKTTLKQLLEKTAGFGRPAARVREQAPWGDLDKDDRTDEALTMLTKFYAEKRTTQRNVLEAKLTNFRKVFAKNLNDPKVMILKAPEQLVSKIGVQELLTLLADYAPHVEPIDVKFPFDYHPRKSTPLDDAYWYMVLSQQPQLYLDLAWQNVYLEPALGNMVNKIRKTKPIRERVNSRKLDDSLLMYEAVKHYDKELTFTPVPIPSISEVSLRERANPGSPYNQMERLDKNAPVTQVGQCATLDWAFADFQKLLANFAKPNYGKLMESHKEHYTFQMAAGNCKITPAAELKDGKPDRAIFCSPLFLRTVGGIFSQTYYKTANHPGQMKSHSWAYGGATRFLGKISERMQTLTGKVADVDYIWDFPVMSPAILSKLAPSDPENHGFREVIAYDINTTPGDPVTTFAYSFPDVKHWDLTRPGCYSDHLKDRHLRYISKIPIEGAWTATKATIWTRIMTWIRFVHKLGRVQTNHRVIFHLPDQTMSGSSDTTEENTDGNLTGRIALQMEAWSHFHPHTTFQQFEANFATGDDLLAVALAGKAKYVAYCNDHMKTVIGQEYKPETVGVHASLSALPFLGRHIVGFEWRRNLAVVAVRPETAILATLVFPKKSPPPAVSPFDFALVRLSSCWDEGALFYPRLRRFMAAYWDRLMLKGAKWPRDYVRELVDADAYFTDLAGDVIALSPVLRSLEDLWFLHTGARAESASDGELSEDPNDKADLENADSLIEDLMFGGPATPSNTNVPVLGANEPLLPAPPSDESEFAGVDLGVVEM